MMKKKANLVISKVRGIIGIVGHDAYDDYDMGDFDWEEDIIVEIEVEIPESMFNPMKLEVQIPEGYRKGAVKGQVEEIQIPIEVMNASAGKSPYFEVADITESGPTGLMAVLRGKVGEFMDGMRSKEEIEEIEAARREKARAGIDRQIADLEKLKGKL